MIAALLVSTLAAAPLTEERAVALALANSPGLKALALDVDQARAEADAAGALENPVLRVTNLRGDRLVTPAFTDAEFPASPFERMQLGLRWDPPNPWTRGHAQDAAARRADEAAQELEEARRALVARVRTLHATALGLDAQIALAREAVDRRADLRTLIVKRLDQHAATVLDQSLADLDWLDALAALQELESRRRQVFSDLLLQLGAAATDATTLAPGAAVACEAPPANPAAMLERATKQSPKVAAFDARLASADAERAREANAPLPWFENVQLGWVLGGDAGASYSTLRFDLPLPVLDLGGAARSALDFRRARIDEERKAEVQSLGRRVHRTLEELAQQAELVHRYRDAEPMIAQGLDRLRMALDAAEADLLQIALVQTRVLAARRAHLRAALECRLTQIELARLVGE